MLCLVLCWIVCIELVLPVQETRSVRHAKIVPFVKSFQSTQEVVGNNQMQPTNYFVFKEGVTSRSSKKESILVEIALIQQITIFSRTDRFLTRM